MAEAPKLFQDEFSIRHGNATFRLIWTDLIDSEDKEDLLAWLALVERRIRRLPDVGPHTPAGVTGTRGETFPGQPPMDAKP